jgi:hypothetical protein
MVKKFSSIKITYPKIWIGIIALTYSIFLHARLGMDGFWDTANYHVYIGWAASELSSFRYGSVAQYHTFLNPIIDIVNYKTYFLHPFVGAAFHSIALSATLVVLSYIAFEVCRSKNNSGYVIYALLAVVMGATGAMTVSLFGSFTNEHITALFLVIALWLSVVYLQRGSLRVLFFSGFLAGAAVGLKLTSTPFSLGLLLSIVLISKFDRRTFLCVIVAAIIGFAAIDGVFMVLRWQETGNPFFPLANNIFQSPFYPSIWISFGKFEPSQIGYYLLLPIRWIYSGDFSEASTVRDGRLFLAYAGLAMLAVSVIFKKEKLNKQELLVVLFFIFSWLLWIVIFRIYRYLVVLELLSGIIFFMGLGKFIPATDSAKKISVILLVSVFLGVVTVYPNWGRRDWGHDFAISNIREKLPPNEAATVIFFADERLSYLAPKLHSMGLGFANLFSQPWYDGDRKRSPIDPVAVTVLNKKNVYFLQYSHNDPSADSSYLRKEFGDGALFKCTELKTNMPWNPYLCKYLSIAEIPQIKLGYTYRLGSDGIILGDGWSTAENWGTWSDGDTASVLLALSSTPKKDIELLIDGHAFLSDKHPSQEVDVLVNNHQVSTLKYDLQSNSGVRVVKIPKALALEKNGQLSIKFNFETPKSPAELGLSTDARRLGLGIVSLEIMTAK